MRLSDDEIIKNISEGKKRHFSLLVDRYKDQAMTLAVRMMRNREDAEEIVQDAFIRAYKGLPSFKGNAKFSTWLYRIVYNLCLTGIDKRKRYPSLVDVAEKEEFSFVDESEIDPHMELESKDTVSLIKRLIGRMPERYSSILALFYFQDLSYDEICEVTQLPLGTVKAHLFRARSMLQRQVAKELKDEFSNA